jgi:hypothetical protein
MKKQIITILALVILLMFSACTAQVHQITVHNPAGFWLGLWHGIICPITFIISLFSDKITVWDIYNNGNWYTLGFLIGASISIGGSSSTATHKK